MKVSLVALLLSLCLCAPALASEVTLQRQLDAQQKTLAEMQNRITELTTQVNTLRADVETLRFELAKSAGNAAPAAAVSTAATAAVAQPKPAAPGSVTATAPAPVKSSTEATGTAQSATTTAATGGALNLKAVDSAAQSAYDAAYARVVSNDLKGAAAAFNAYVVTYPDNTLTPNAWYWLGQVQYKQNDLDNARVSFLNVARFTSSTKRPDALYKLGLISKMRGEKDKAAAYFNLVIRTYPADTSSDLARRELAAQG